MMTPIVYIFFSSSHTTGTLVSDGLQLGWGGQFAKNYASLLTFEAGFADEVTPFGMLINSLIVALGVGSLTTLFSFLTAYAIVFFRFPHSVFVFWLVLVTLLFPLEARFINTFEVTSILGLINTHAGIILPALAVALGTFFYRQFFLTLPEELLEAALLDGAGPIKFLRDILVPMSWTRTGAIFVISFMVGWNQYLWPLMISTDDTLYTLVRGIRLIGQESGPGMALVILTITPPLFLLLIFQRWFFNAFSMSEK